MRNLKRDVFLKTASLEFDKNYIEYFDRHDQNELDKKLNDATIKANDEKMNEDGEELTEKEKDVVKIKAKLRFMTEGFFGP